MWLSMWRLKVGKQLHVCVCVCACTGTHKCVYLRVCGHVSVDAALPTSAHTNASVCMRVDLVRER